MKRLLLSSFFFLIIHSVFAQQQYFIYLESENGIPFYVRMGDKIYSSAAPGYLVFPNLADSSYTFFIGVPGLGGKESRFQLKVQGHDHGYSIKTSGNEFALADLQSQAVINPVRMEGMANVTYEPRKDAFSAMLSKASNDSSLLMTPVFSKTDAATTVSKKKDVDTPKPVEKSTEPPVPVSEPSSSSTTVITQKTTPEEPAVVKDTTTTAPMPPTSSANQVAANNNQSTVLTEESKQTEVKNEVANSSSEPATSTAPVATEQPFQRSVIKKYSESSTSEGFGLVFFDKEGDHVDTVRMLIPNPKIIFKDHDTTQKEGIVFMEAKKEAEPASKNAKEPSSSVKSEEKKEEPKAKDITATDQMSDSVINKETIKEERAVGGIIPAKPKCRAQASENDFFRLRKNMASEESDELMVDEAKKVFKTKCLTTEQVKYLSSLFLTSAGKYLFFDAAYMHVSDRENFPSLQSEIKDDYYSRRFKALIGE